MEQILRVDAGNLQLAGPNPDRGRKAGEFAVRHVRRRGDDDAALGQVAADFRKLVPQTLAALGFEETLRRRRSSRAASRASRVDQERPARIDYIPEKSSAGEILRRISVW